MTEQNYTVTARKFRPQTFSEIVGQKHIVQTLTNALTKQRIGHAYLFSGTRGVGKTTSARILAKALNCEQGPTPTPCLECTNCTEITKGSAIDVIEIDGASNTGVDNIRELRENVRFSPTRSKYKIYIIDEVHQISKHAFNALLKTLEEPPDHVVFIFATTELSKVPDTILSRCQNFEYRSISQADIAAQLKMVAKKENIDVADSAIALLSRRAKGSMRDAQSLLDQTAAFGGGKVTSDDVKLILGMVDEVFVTSVMDAIVGQDNKTLFGLAEEITQTGADPALFLEDLAQILRNVAGIKAGAINPEKSEDKTGKLVEWAKALDHSEIQSLFAIIVETLSQLRISSQPSINLEMGLLRMAEGRSAVSVESILNEVEKAQTMIENEAGPEPLVVVEKAPVAKQSQSLPQPVSASAEFEIVESVSKNAPEDLISEFKKVSPTLIGIFGHSKTEIHDDAVVITVPQPFEQESLVEKEVADELALIAGRVMGKKMRIVVKLADSAKKKDSAVTRKKTEARETSIRRQVADLPIVQDALELFNGEIVEVKVEKGG